MQRALSALERVLPVAAAISRGVRTASFVALAAAAAIVLVLFRDGLPEPQSRALVAVAAAAAALAPGGVLFAFHLALGQLLEVPARLRALPGAGREHADELGKLVRERGGGRRLPLRLWKLFVLGRSSRELLRPYAPLMPLFSVPFLLAAGVSLLLTPLLVVAALVALLWAA